MKQFKFLLNYKQIFETRQEDIQKVNQLLEQLLESPAMKDIVALEEEGKAVGSERGSTKIGPKRIYQINISNGILKINFMETFTSRDSYINVNDDGTYTFRTAERTASWAGDTPEQKAASESYFRKLEKEQNKNKFPLLRIKTDYISGKQIEKLEDLKSQAEKWNKKYNADIVISDNAEDIKTQLYDFMIAYNDEMLKNQEQAKAEGHKKYVAYTSQDFPVIMNFDDLEDCLRWAWAFFITRKTPRNLDPYKTFDYLMSHKDLWNKELPIGERYGRRSADIENFLDGSLNNNEIIDQLKLNGGGIRSIVASEIKNIDRTTQFLKQVFKLIGLDFVKTTKGSFGSGYRSRGAVPEEELTDLEKKSEREKWIIGFEISKVLSTENTILSLAAKRMTEGSIEYTDHDLVFQLSKRPEFTLTKLGSNINTEISGNKVLINIEARTEQEALLQLVTGYKFKQDDKDVILGPWISKAFTESDDVKIKGEKIEATTFLNIIRKFTELLGQNLNNFIPNSKNNPLFDIDAIPTNIEENDPRILKIIAATINSSLELKRKLKEENEGLYAELVANGLTKLPEDTSTEEKPVADKDKKSRRKKSLE